MPDDVQKDLNEARYRLHKTRGALAYHLELFGDHLQEKEGYSFGGIEAIMLYLIRKYAWTPQYVKSMSSDDMRFVLDVELRDWRVPTRYVFEDY